MIKMKRRDKRGWRQLFDSLLARCRSGGSKEGDCACGWGNVRGNSQTLWNTGLYIKAASGRQSKNYQTQMKTLISDVRWIIISRPTTAEFHKSIFFFVPPRHKKYNFCSFRKCRRNGSCGWLALSNHCASWRFIYFLNVLVCFALPSLRLSQLFEASLLICRLVLCSGAAERPWAVSPLWCSLP